MSKSSIRLIQQYSGLCRTGVAHFVASYETEDKDRISGREAARDAWQDHIENCLICRLAYHME